jgi:hypothetical protein
MSRFWGGNSSSSDEQDSRSEDESSVEMRKPQANTGKIFAGAFDESDSGISKISHPQNSLHSTKPFLILSKTRFG